MKTPNRTKSPKGAAVLSVLLAAVCAVSAAYAVRISADRGITSDAVFCIVIAAVSAFCILAIIVYYCKFRHTSRIAKIPVFYTMTAGPNEEVAQKSFKIKGKMPPKDH